MTEFVLNGLDQSALTANGTAKQAVEETACVAQTLDERAITAFGWPGITIHPPLPVLRRKS